MRLRWNVEIEISPLPCERNGAWNDEEREEDEECSSISFFLFFSFLDEFRRFIVRENYFDRSNDFFFFFFLMKDLRSKKFLSYDFIVRSLEFKSSRAVRPCRRTSHT